MLMLLIKSYFRHARKNDICMLGKCLPCKGKSHVMLYCICNCKSNVYKKDNHQEETRGIHMYIYHTAAHINPHYSHINQLLYISIAITASLNVSNSHVASPSVFLLRLLNI